MDLAPITTSKLEGRTGAWGKELNVVDGAGLRVIEVRLGTAVKPPYAVFRTANGEWRVERTDPFLPPGPKRSGLGGRAERLDVVDSSGDVVATMSSGRLTLAEGEELTWVYPGRTTLCGLGDGLWVARAHWPRRRGKPSGNKKNAQQRTRGDGCRPEDLTASSSPSTSRSWTLNRSSHGRAAGSTPVRRLVSQPTRRAREFLPP
jgi:hypothetical protein